MNGSKPGAPDARTLLAAVLALALVAVIVVWDRPAPAAETAKGRVAGEPVNVRSAPHLGNNVLYTVKRGTEVQIFCQAFSDAVQGPWGSNTVWNKIHSSEQRWIADAWVYTGFEARIPGVPQCQGSKSEGKPTVRPLMTTLHPNGYLWKWEAPNTLYPDGLTYFKGECTSFAAWAVQNDGIGDGPKESETVRLRGDANEWEGYTYFKGTTIVRNPLLPKVIAKQDVRAGDVAQWEAGVNGASSAGHVAYVASVLPNSMIRIWEYNWIPKRFDSRVVSLDNPSRFLRF